jgi:hypothetical protein
VSSLRDGIVLFAVTGRSANKGREALLISHSLPFNLA